MSILHKNPKSGSSKETLDLLTDPTKVARVEGRRDFGRDFFSEENRRVRAAKYKRFCQLWLDRHQNNVAPELLIYLDEPESRRVTIRALGRMEAKDAEAPLQGILTGIEKADAARKEYLDYVKSEMDAGRPRPNENLPSPSPDRNSRMTLKLALARIRSGERQNSKPLQKVSIFPWPMSLFSSRDWRLNRQTVQSDAS